MFYFLIDITEEWYNAYRGLLASIVTNSLNISATLDTYCKTYAIYNRSYQWQTVSTSWYIKWYP